MMRLDSGDADRPKKTAILLAQRLVRQIITEDLPPGAMLPPEREMLEGYGVGRATLREALRYLELQGVLTIRPGPRGGPMVAAPTARPLASTFALMLEMERTPFSDIVDARATLEPVLAGLAAERISLESLAEVEDACETMWGNLDRIDVFREQNHRFHEAVAAASGNHVYRYLLSSLHWISDGTPMGIDYPLEQRRAVAKAHERILGALRDHDADAAVESMRSHMGEFARYVTKQYPAVMAQPVGWGSHYT